MNEKEMRGAFRVLRAVFVGQSIESDGSLSAGTFEESFDGIVPPQAMILLHTTIRRLEVGVTTLEAREQDK